MINIDLINDTPDAVNTKLDLMAKQHKIQREQDSFQDRRYFFKVMFWILFTSLVLFGGWAFYVFANMSTYGAREIDVAKYVLGTLASSAVAALIGLVATQPK